MNVERALDASVHPDLALLMQPRRRAICCLVIEKAQEEQLAALRTLAPFHVYRQNGLCAMLFDDTDQRFPVRTKKILTAQHLCAGLSGPFALAASARGCMTKARIALATGRAEAPEKVLYPMDVYGEEALLLASREALAASGFSCRDFCDASIEEMERVDAREGTQYAESLRAYLACALNLRQAAQQLGIHRNTLAYRMKRIEERFALNLEDMNTCFELLFAFWLMDHLPEAPSAKPAEAFDALKAQARLWRCVERAGSSAPETLAFSAVLLCVGAGGLNDGERSQLMLALCGLPGGSACAYDDDALFFALRPEDAPAFLEACKPLCRTMRCPIVVTQAFDASRLGQKVRLCRFALRAVSASVTRMQEIGSTLFFMALERRMSLSPYLCEDVIRVMDDDATKGAALARALYAYLLNFRDLKKAAQQLGMHRNTMEYQLKKIEQLIGETPGKKKRFMMMCTYKMLALPDTGLFDL